MRRLGTIVLALALLGFVPGRSEAAAPATCPGISNRTTTFTGEFTPEDEGSYLLVPFEVPSGTTKVHVSLCYDSIDAPSNPFMNHTLDLGLYQPTGDGFYDQEEFRGWGGSNRRDAFVSPDAATNGFLPGTIPGGTWAAEIGVASVAGLDEGDLDEKVAWRLDVKLTSDPADADNPWNPPPYDQSQGGGNLGDDGWYAGDFHVHAEHSGGALMQDTFDYAFKPRSQGGAGLDFVTLSDYVTTRHWRELRQYQDQHPGKLIVRSAEVITYRGHINNHGSVDWADYRTGDISLLDPSTGTRTPVRSAGDNPPWKIFNDIHANYGWTQVNHPTTFPADIPYLGNFCRGCSWEYSDAETQWALVDAMEVQTGPAGTYDVDGVPGSTGPVPVETDGLLGPNPFTPLAIEWWDRLHREGAGERLGYDITAVGSSDSHAADHQELTQSPVGEATTMVHAQTLNEWDIGEGVRSGRAYIRFFGSGGPTVDTTMHCLLGCGATVEMGGELTADPAKVPLLNFSVSGYREGSSVVVVRDGVPVATIPLTGVGGATFGLSFPAAVPGDWRIQVMRGSAIEALTNPITLILPGDSRSHTHV